MTRFSVRTAARRVGTRWIAFALAAITVVIGLWFSTMVASGADSYGYVSQVDLWLKGELAVPHRFANELPWPSKARSVAPLGYEAVARPDGWAIVPTYSAGLPMLMAAAKLIGGQCAVYAVVPISGGVLVLITYALGGRLGSSLAGLIGAWLVATSPAFLFMLMWPMTDVPVSAAWAIAFYFLLGSTRGSILAAGLAAAVAILVRPNLFLAAGVMAAWYLIRTQSSETTWRHRLTDAAIFALGVAPGIIATAVIYRHLFGSVTRSGYGGFGSNFTATNIVPNLQRYLAWFVDSHSVLPIAGLLALFLPVRRLWPGVADLKALGIIAAFVSSIWSQYLAYRVFDDWWYLRFLLPSWPFIMIGVGMCAVALTRADRPLANALVAIGIIALGLVNVKTAIDRNAFELWRDERRYATVGRLVERLTDPRSMIFTMQHSGSVRYYGGRMTLRYDILDEDWLDRAVAWLSEREVSSYLLAEEWEETDFRRRFPRAQTLARLDLPPLLEYRGDGKIALYDLSHPRSRDAAPLRVRETAEHTCSIEAAPLPTPDSRSR